MAVPKSVQNALLGALAVAAVGTSALAFWSVNRPPESTGSGSTSVVTPSPQVTGDPSAATGEPGAAGSPDSDGTSGTAGPADDDASTASGVDAWLEAWAGDDSNLLVVGDGYSALPSQWVQLWGDRLGDDRPVTVRHWSQVEDDTFDEPVVLSEVDGSGLTIWNASRDDTTITTAAERFEEFLAEPDDIDAVLVSLGRGSADEVVAAALDALVGEIDEEVPVLVAVGPSGLFAPQVTDAMLEWAQDNDDRVVLVDLSDSAPEDPTAEEWAAAFDEALGGS